MSKLSFFFTTLIAAIPAAFLGYLCVAAFLFHAGALPPLMMGIAGITLLLCVAVVAMPVYVLLSSTGRAAPETAAEESAEAGSESDEFAVGEESEAASEDDGDLFVEEHDEDFDDTSK